MRDHVMHKTNQLGLGVRYRFGFKPCIRPRGALAVDQLGLGVGFGSTVRVGTELK